MLGSNGNMKKSELSHQQYLRELAQQLDEAERVGALEDVPEGARTIHMTDTLARDIADRLRRIADSL